jgi:hypothetical protein
MELGALQNIPFAVHPRGAGSGDKVCDQMQSIAIAATLRPFSFELFCFGTINGLAAELVSDSGAISEFSPVQVRYDDVVMEQLLVFGIPIVLKISREGHIAFAQACRAGGNGEVLLHSKSLIRGGN